MRYIALLIAVIAAGGYYAYVRDQEARQRTIDTQATERQQAPLVRQTRAAIVCDGRTTCSQMTSCEEATYFLKNCPNTKMDGDGDGIPCEQQWCHN